MIMDIRNTAEDFARTFATDARMERAYSVVGRKMGVFVKRVVDDVMRDFDPSDPAFEVAATQAVSAVAADWFTRRASRTSR